jgi:Tfp pilus assembly protein PilF
MTLNRAQKKYLKKNLKRYSLAKIATDLNLPEKEILEFLKTRWRREKYQQFLRQQREDSQSSSPLPLKTELVFKKWLGRNWKILAFLAFLVFVVYLNSLGNDFVSDDIASIRDNALIDQVSFFWKPPDYINLRGFVLFLTKKLFDLNPLFYRLTNILFHLGSVWVIYFLIGLFFSSPLPLITASLFAVHPLLTESITWISGGSYSNGAFFIFSSLLAYVYATRFEKRKVFILSLILFLLATFFSEKLLVFSAALFLYELLFGHLKNNWPKLIPFGLISGFWALYLLGMIGVRSTVLQTTFYQEPGTNNPLIQIPVAITSYLELAFWPKDLTLYHADVVISQTEYLLRLGGFILFLAALAYFFKKNRGVFFWLFFLLISLSPTLTPLRLSWVVAERYVYLGAVGIFVLMAWLIKKIADISQNQKVLFVLLGILLFAFSARTMVRNRDWKNQDTLWLATDKVSPESPQNHNNLGDLYFRRGEPEKAVEEFQTAIKLKPNYGDAYHNLANVYREMGQDDLAIANYQKALSFNPHLWQSYQNIAGIYFGQKNAPLAKENMEKAVAINPQSAELQTNLGLIYLKMGESQKAKELFLKALEIDPNYQRAKEGLLSLD